MSKLAHIMDARETPNELLQRLVDTEDSQTATAAMVIFLYEDALSYRTVHDQARITNAQMIALLMDQIREIQDEMRE